MILGLLDRVVFACGVILFLQLPTFIHQYTHRLGGFQRAQSEQIEGFEEIANAHFGGDMQSLIQTFENSDMQSVRDTASNIETSLDNQVAIQKDLTVLEGDSLTNKIFYLVRHLRYNLAEDTVRNFTPNIPLNVASFIYGLLGGILFSLLFFLVIRLPSEWVTKKIRKKSSAS